jgi:hypothetical protein
MAIADAASGTMTHIKSFIVRVAEEIDLPQQNKVVEESEIGL